MFTKHKSELDQRIKKLCDDRRQLSDDIQKLVRDKSIPLKERWDFFSGSDFGLSDCACSFDTLPDIDFYAELYWERHAELHVSEIEVRLYDVDDPSLTEDQLNLWREEMLQGFIGSITCDW